MKINLMLNLLLIKYQDNLIIYILKIKITLFNLDDFVCLLEVMMFKESEISRKNEFFQTTKNIPKIFIEDGVDPQPHIISSDNISILDSKKYSPGFFNPHSDSESATSFLPQEQSSELKRKVQLEIDSLENEKRSKTLSDEWLNLLISSTEILDPNACSLESGQILEPFPIADPSLDPPISGVSGYSFKIEDLIQSKRPVSETKEITLDMNPIVSDDDLMRSKELSIFSQKEINGMIRDFGLDLFRKNPEINTDFLCINSLTVKKDGNLHTKSPK